MRYYKQTKAVSWLPATTKGTVWVSTFGDYIQPEDETLRRTPLGVDLSLLDDESLSLFLPISTISIEAQMKQLNIAGIVRPASESAQEGEPLPAEGVAQSGSASRSIISRCKDCGTILQWPVSTTICGKCAEAPPEGALH